MDKTFCISAALLATEAAGHGHLTYPPSTRHGGTLKLGNDCKNQACLWFSNNVEIPGAISLPNDMRSLQLNVTGQPQDVYATSPWRAPGSAPVFGSGCGVGGGSNETFLNGGVIVPASQQGMDGLDLPPVGAPEVWTRGATAEIAWAIAANHGGGYSYRLCPNDGRATVDEACFQAHPLDFAGNTSEILHADGTRIAFPLRTTRVGTTPAGSEWARDPIPQCYVCDAYAACGAPLAPAPGPANKRAPTACDPVSSEAACEATKGAGGNACSWYAPKRLCYDADAPKPKPNAASIWEAQVQCYGMCAGAGASKAAGSCAAGGVPPSMPPPLPPPQYSGYGKGGFDWSVADKVKVPSDLAPGKYLLSWRWDCEESTQVWQNCADIVLE
jgi:hypothetical protein